MVHGNINHGDELRLPFWTDAVLVVQDIGVISFWGQVVDIKTRIVREHGYIASFVEEWEIVKPAKEVIKKLKIKNK